MQRQSLISVSKYSNSNKSGASQISEELCIFCTTLNINRCMMISVIHKHHLPSNFYQNMIDALIMKTKSSLNSKFDQFVKLNDHQQFMTQYYQNKKIKKDMIQFLEYYKFRKFVPIFVDKPLGNILHSYYYERLKVYYNQIKRQLKIAVDKSSQTQFSQSEESSKASKKLDKQQILCDLTQGYSFLQQKDSIQNYKTQSKAFQDLVYVLKSHQKDFEKKNLRQLRFEQKISLGNIQRKCSKEIFKDHILLARKNSKKINTKEDNSKVFITLYNNTNQRIKSQSKIIKQIGTKEKEKKIVQQKNVRNTSLQKPQTSAKLIFSKKTNQNLKKSSQLSTPIKKQMISIKLHEKIQSVKQTQRKNKQFGFIRGKSEVRIRKQIRSLGNKKNSEKRLTDQAAQEILSGRKLSVGKLKETKQIKQSKKIQKSRRKSLDLTKLKTKMIDAYLPLLEPSIKQEKRSQRYDKFQDSELKTMLRTTNVSPSERRIKKDLSNEINVEKNDNIISIRKKKLEVLKKKNQIHKI